jgi:hypothetical protein
MDEIQTKRRNYTQDAHNLDKLKEKWPSPFVSRDRIYEFTDGILKQTGMNTLDARGTGIQKRYRIGRRVFYETESIINWMKERAKTGEK